MSAADRDDDAPRGALGPVVPAAADEPEPAMQLANSLEVATPRHFVHVDRHGQVRSPARYRALQAVSYGMMGSSVAAATVLYGMSFGVPGLAVGVGLGLYVGRAVLRGRKLQRAAGLLLHDRVDEAEALLHEVINSWRCPARLRAIAEQNLAGCDLRRGDHAAALEHLRTAMVLFAGVRRPGVLAQLAEYAEVTTLVNLDRVKEARARLTERHRAVPDGDYLRLHHWIAELYVALAEGDHTLDADALHDRARTALGITGAGQLLGLTAWAHHRNGDLDQAWHLLHEAFDRPTGVPIERALPRLHAWMIAHRAIADAAVEAADPYAMAEAAEAAAKR